MLQLQMIERVKQVSLENPAISAVLMYGSFIKGEGDQYSDIEFYIFHTGDYMPEKMEFINNISPVSLFFVNEFGTEVAVFTNMIRGEFHFHPVTGIEIIKTWQGGTSFEYRDKMNLVDKDGRLSDVLASINEPLRPVYDTQENKEFLALNLINNLLFEQNLLLRKEYAHAHQLFWFIQRYLLWMIRLHVGMDDHWESPTKKLEKELPEEWYQKYRQCVPELEEVSLRKSFIFVLDISDYLFKKLEISSSIYDVLKKIKL